VTYIIGDKNLLTLLTMHLKIKFHTLLALFLSNEFKEKKCTFSRNILTILQKSLL